MRRKDRERTDIEFIDEVFQKAEVLYLAMHDGNFPYCLPLNFAQAGDKIYIHSAKEGHKLDCLLKNPNVSFALACDVIIDREHFTTLYKSVCGQGHASLVDDVHEKCRALDLIGKHYSALCPSPATPEMAARIAIIRIDILDCSGKECKGKKS